MEAHTQGDVLAGAFFLPFESSSAAVIFVVCDVSFSVLPGICGYYNPSILIGWMDFREQLTFLYSQESMDWALVLEGYWNQIDTLRSNHGKCIPSEFQLLFPPMQLLSIILEANNKYCEVGICRLQTLFLDLDAILD